MIALVLAGAALIGLLAAFFLLYLRVPEGWSPTTGFAPATARLFLGRFPYPTVALGPDRFRVASVTLVVAMWAAYAAALLLINRITAPFERERALRVVVAVAVAAHLVLVLLPPVFSTDLYRYGLFGRMGVVYGLNPYATPADTLASDALWPYAGWRHLRSHYGAAFLWVATATSVLGGGGPVGTAFAFKAVAAAFNLAAAWAVWRLARETSTRDGLGALALYALNPALLAESAGSAHPEPIMFAFALWGAYFWWRGRTTAGFALLVVSAAVQYLTGILALLVAVHTVARAGAGRLAIGARLIAVAGVVVLVLYAPFLRGASVFETAAELVAGGGSPEAGAQSAPATPKVALGVGLALLAGAAAIAARGPRAHVFDLTALIVTFLLLFALRTRMPWYFLTAVALTIPAAPTPSNRVIMSIALLLAMLGMLLYCALVPLGP